MLKKVNRQLAVFDFIRAALSRQSPENGPDSGGQFTGTEWLGHIVVRSQTQAGELVLVGGPGGEHDNRYLGFISQSAADLQAIDAGQHDVQHDKVGMALSCLSQSLNAVISGEDAVAIPMQVELDQLYCFYIVIDNQDSFSCHLEFLNGPPYFSNLIL